MGRQSMAAFRLTDAGATANEGDGRSAKNIEGNLADRRVVLNYSGYAASRIWTIR